MLYTNLDVMEYAVTMETEMLEDLWLMDEISDEEIEAVEFLTTEEVGAWVSNNEETRKVIIENMCGGKYLLIDCGEISGLTDNIIEAINFLKE